MAVTEEAQNTKDAYAPFEEMLAITPADATLYDPPLRGVIVTVAGNLRITTSKGTVITFAVFVGQLIPALITIVGTATTATVVGGR